MLTLLLGLVVFYLLLKVVGWIFVSFFSLGGFVLKGLITVILGIIGFVFLFSVVGFLAVLICPCRIVIFSREFKKGP